MATIEKQLMDDILPRGIKPHARVLAPIISQGDVAVVVYIAGAMGRQTAHRLGRKGNAPAFKMDRNAREQLIAAMVAMGDHVTARWLRGDRPGRIFVITGGGTLLVNFEQGVGFSLEPGSTDRGMA